MSRKSNEEIRNMTIKESGSYASDHPAEACRVRRELTKAAVVCGKVQVQYTFNQVFSPVPDSVTVKL